jgi:hypothetical protein
MAIRLEQAKPGMVLARDVRDRRGRLLLAAGQALSSQALRIFRMWGVGEVEVTGSASPTPTATVPPDPERLAQARVEAERLFRHANVGHPVVGELVRLTTARLAARPARTRHAR